jgi:CSLREA domain-containing protein
MAREALLSFIGGGKSGTSRNPTMHTKYRLLSAPVANAIPLLWMLLTLAPGMAQAAVFVVNSTLDTSDAAPGNALCNDGGGNCTLRAAIQETNSLPGADVINFNIGGGGVQTISPATGLPAISSAVTIDGTTQPGFAGTPIIELEGSGAPAGADGLFLTGSGTTIRGLVVNRFDVSVFSGIRVNSSNNVIAGNYVGTDVTGTIALGNTRGVSLGGSNNRVGGTTLADRNLLSGNGDGLHVAGGPHTIEGNFIGTDAAGTAALGNQIGVNIFGGNDILVGGTGAGAGNVISGNTSTGVIIQGTSIGDRVQGNRIGTQVDGVSALGNAVRGVWLRNLPAASQALIGGTLAGEGNVIAFNSIGVGLSGPTPSNENSILRNSIHSNTQLGIDLGVAGVTPNDAGDADTTDNDGQNFPVLDGAFGTATSIEISGTLESLPATEYHIELFVSPECDPSGHGEGETYLGSIDDTTDGDETLQFSTSIAGAAEVGDFITATATDPAGNTSEFSACVEIVGCPASPRMDCLTGFGKAQLGVSDKVAGKESLKLGWLKGPAFAGHVLGNPLASGGTVYFVCVYDGAASLARPAVQRRSRRRFLRRQAVLVEPWRASGRPRPQGLQIQGQAHHVGWNRRFEHQGRRRGQDQGDAQRQEQRRQSADVAACGACCVAAGFVERRHPAHRRRCGAVRVRDAWNREGGRRASVQGVELIPRRMNCRGSSPGAGCGGIQLRSASARPRVPFVYAR